MSNKPVLFLAFANDLRPDGVYLPNLSREANESRAQLDKARKAGLCELVVRTGVSAQGVLDVFGDPEYRNRIALFHYAGHAEDYLLLLQEGVGESATADARGLAAFLKSQHALQLVFLNACATREQVQYLLDVGISAVIATSQLIEDTLATDFAIQFYTSLANGASLQHAFDESKGAIQFKHSELTAQLQAQPSLALDHFADGQPWALYSPPGAEVALQWNLPQAAGDPLFGLPPLPLFDLPEEPYRYLSWYERQHAELFFGRGRDIRKLYDAAIAVDGAPLILLYGQSGVGKSSLLAAGLMPRLESLHTVRYVRRKDQGGMMGALAEVISGSSEAQPADGEIGRLRDWWVEQENNTGKPLTLIVDQVEEVFTQGGNVAPGEMENFVAVLQSLFRQRAQRPRGKLILGFRKEWLPEIEQQLSQAKLPRSTLFLDRIDRDGIMEIVLGPSQSPRLQEQYHLQVEASLPVVIADDLLEDRDSPVAPTLQTLLSKLWRRAKQANGAAPHFTLDLYQSLKREGILLGDFLDQQIEEIRRWQPGVVESGLQLDLLAAHTTERGTAAQHTQDELLKLYAGEYGVNIADLIEQNCDQRLLVDPAGSTPAGDGTSTLRATRLVHDTLAPLVRERYEKSDKPGQRARRILENRAVDWQDGKAGAPLDEADLKVVEAGQTGMRSWTAAETKLIEASRQARAAQQLARRQRRLATIGAVTVILLFAILAGVLWRRSEGLRQTSEERLNQALLSESKRFANLALQQLAVDPVASVNLAIAALPEAERPRPYLADAEFALAQAVRTVQEAYYLPVRYLQSAAQVAVRDQTIALGGDGLYLVDWSQARPISSTVPLSLSLIGMDWSQTGQLLGYEHTTLHVWEGSHEVATQKFLSDEGIRCARWNPQRREIAVCDGHMIRIWSPEGENPPLTVGDIDADETSFKRDLAWSSDGRWLAAWGAQFLLWDSQSNQLVYQASQEETFAYIRQAEWSPGGSLLALQWQGEDAPTAPGALTLLTPDPAPITRSVVISGGLMGWHLLTDQDLATWDVAGMLELRTADGTLRQTIGEPTNDRPLADLLLAPDQRSLLLYRYDNQAEIRNLEDGSLIATLGGQTGHQGVIINAAWSPHSVFVATAGDDGIIKIWGSSSGQLLTTLAGSERLITDLRWLTNNRLLSVSQADVLNDLPGSLHLWNLADATGDFACMQEYGSDVPFCERYSQPIALPYHTASSMPDNISRMTWKGTEAIQVVSNLGALYSVQLDSQQMISLPAESDVGRLVVSNPAGDQVLTYQDGGDGQFWQAGQQGWHELDRLTGPIHDAQWSGNGLLVSNAEGQVDFVEPPSLARTLLLTDTGLLQAIDVGQGKLALADQAGVLFLLATGSKQLTALHSVFDGGGQITLDATAEGNELVAGYSMGVARWAMKGDNAVDEVYFVTTGFDQSPITLSPDGRYVAVAQDGFLVVVDMEEKRELVRKSINNALLTGVKWSSDGSRLLAWDDESAWLLRWDSEQGIISPILQIARQPFSSPPALSPDGSQLLAIDLFSELRLWKVWRDLPELMNDARSCCLTRPLSDQQQQEFGLP